VLSVKHDRDMTITLHSVALPGVALGLLLAMALQSLVR
jgi:hypothetical protein